MRNCAACGQPCDPDNPETYHEVRSWVNGPKLDGPKLREQTGDIAHKDCIDRMVAGQAPDQPKLFEEDNLSFGAQMGHPGGHYG
jgi:hypothetical protein